MKDLLGNIGSWLGRQRPIASARTASALVVTFALALAAQSASAFSLWPFGGGSDTNKPPRLHVLLADANDFIELAEDAALDGDADKALENYKKAIGELNRVEFENPDRADKPEFAPLRNKRAACQAAMDSIRFIQINQNVKPVAVTDTAELEKKYAAKKAGDAAKKMEQEEKAEAASEKPASEEKKSTQEEATPAQVDKAKPAQANVAEKPAEKEPAPAPGTAAPSDFKGKMATALGEIKRGEYAAADLLLESLLKEKPNDLNVLVLRAAAQSGSGNYYAARRTLEKAQRAHPRSYIPCYNLAVLALKLGEGKESARQYYEMSREFGGPRDVKLEGKLQ